MSKGKLLKPRRGNIFYTVLNNFSTSKAFRIALHQDCGMELKEEFAEVLRPDGVIELIPRRIFKAGDYE